MALRVLASYARRARRSPEVRCELCSAPIGDRHAHVVELASQAMRCACSACAVLFRDAGAAGGRFRTVPDRVLRLAFTPTAEEWTRIEVPVELAFLVRGAGWTAFYPSPAGSVESPLSDAAGEALLALLPRAAEVEPQVEALLLRRPRTGAAECFLLPIDACFDLVGQVRKKWQGFDGGDQVRAAIDHFLDHLREVAE